MKGKSIAKSLNSNELVIVYVWTSGFNLWHPSKGEITNIELPVIGEVPIEIPSVGHISIWIPSFKKYISLWPKQGPEGTSAKETEGLGLLQPITHELLPNYEKDREYEGRSPEFVFEFRSLKSRSMVENFDEHKFQIEGWALLGSLGGLICKDGESCASLAWKILCSGGIESLVSLVDQGFISSKGCSSGFGFSSSHSAKSSLFFSSSDMKQSVQSSKQSSHASSYAVEMASSIFIKSPDALAAILTKAKENELEKYPETKPSQIADHDNENQGICLLM